MLQEELVGHVIPVGVPLVTLTATGLVLVVNVLKLPVDVGVNVTSSGLDPMTRDWGSPLAQL